MALGAWMAIAIGIATAVYVGGSRAQTGTTATGPAPAGLAKATFAGGCFWCVESDFDKVPGVISTTSGYTGGKVANPSYEQVSAKGTGHAEAVEIVYDPKRVSYDQLLEYFWHTIDPTTKDRQFCDAGTPYRTAIFAQDAQQIAAANASLARLERAKPFKEPVVTEIALAGPFYAAEEYHQDYYKKNPLRYKYYRTFHLAIPPIRAQRWRRWRHTLATMLRWIGPILSLAALPGALAADAPASAPAVTQRGLAQAACERAVQSTLRDTRGGTATPAFNAAPVMVPGAADAAEITLRGAGQVRTAVGARPFSYSCNFEIASSTVTGVVVRDAAVAAAAAVVAKPVEPDLSALSPAACESAAAASLKRRWPSVSRISFNADTRQLSQDSGGMASLRGQGSAAPSLRDVERHFSYDCAIDARNGRVMKVSVGD
jgi:peptide-methionine (S)-S-oxide reductase